MADIQMAGSFLIGSLVLLTILSMNAEILETSSLNSLGKMAQENMTEIASIIDYDFKKIGYLVDRDSTAILGVTDSSISFLADIDQDGVIDTVSYRVGSTSEPTATDNPNDRYLYRKVNSTEYDVALGITAWELSYYTEGLTVTTNPDDIRMIQISLSVGTMFGFDEKYGRASWTNQIVPKNIGAI